MFHYKAKMQNLLKLRKTQTLTQVVLFSWFKFYLLLSSTGKLTVLQPGAVLLGPLPIWISFYQQADPFAHAISLMSAILHLHLEEASISEGLVYICFHLAGHMCACISIVPLCQPLLLKRAWLHETVHLICSSFSQAFFLINKRDWNKFKSTLRLCWSSVGNMGSIYMRFHLFVF